MADARRVRRPLAPTYGAYARATTGRRGVARSGQERRSDLPLPGVRGVLLLATLAAVAWGVVWLARSPYFTVTEVRVSGAKSLDPQTVRDASGLLGRNVFDLDIAGARARIRALPNVDDADVQRTGLNAVRIRITEREPWALWQVQGRRYAIDARGYVLDRTLPDEGAPVIVNTDAVEAPKPGDRVDPGAVELVRTLTERTAGLGANVARWEYRQRDGLTAVLEGGLRITLGDARDTEYKLAVLEALLAETARQGLRIQAVDLRFGDRLSFR
jgi:cell division protein FtsQ